MLPVLSALQIGCQETHSLNFCLMLQDKNNHRLLQKVHDPVLVVDYNGCTLTVVMVMRCRKESNIPPDVTLAPHPSSIGGPFFAPTYSLSSDVRFPQLE